MNPLDIACWDIIGKAAERPLYQLWGACRDRVPVYASAGLWMSSGLDELRAEARAFLEQGFKAMKVRLGSARWQDDVARVEALRDVIGDDIALMADSNQGLDLPRALRLGRALERFELKWYEEPLPPGTTKAPPRSRARSTRRSPTARPNTPATASATWSRPALPTS